MYKQTTYTYTYSKGFHIKNIYILIYILKRFSYTYSKGHQKAKKPSRVMPLGSSLLANEGGGRVLILVCF